MKAIISVLTAMATVVVLALLWPKLTSDGARPEESLPNSPASSSVKTLAARPLSSLPSMPLGLSLAATSALASEGSTFSSDQAGLAAYVKVGSLDLTVLADSFDELYESGGNWVVGKQSINVGGEWVSSSGGLTQTVYVYGDSEGWLVAYLGADIPPAAIMVWPAGVDADNPLIEDIGKTALDVALERAVNSTGGSYALEAPNVGYFDFRQPEANLIVLAATEAKSPDASSPAQLYLSVPVGYTWLATSVSVAGLTSYHAHSVTLITGTGAVGLGRWEGRVAFSGFSASPGDAYLFQAATNYSWNTTSPGVTGIAVAVVLQRPE